MSVLLGILTRLGIRSNDSEVSGLEVLQSVLRERETSLRLEAVYEEPTVNVTGETTAIFPMTLYYEGERYGAHGKEFVVPDDGLQDSEAPLTKFLNGHGISSVEEIGAIEGVTVTATLGEDGNVEVTR